MWSEGVTIEEAQAWLSEPQFITDFGVALDAYGKSVEAQEDKSE
jgi:hypothetical protein